MKYELIFMGLMFSVLLMCAMDSTFAHEQAHVVINSYFGVKSHSEVYGLGIDGGKTINDSNFLSANDKEFAMLGNSMNEAIGYQLTPLFLMLGGILILGFMYLGSKIEGIQKP